MAATERVTVTLLTSLIQRIDRLDRNRSRFIARAIRNELARRRREGLLRSLEHPHPETTALAALGLADWAAHRVPGDDGLVDVSSGTPVRWVEGQGFLVETA